MNTKAHLRNGRTGYAHSVRVRRAANDEIAKLSATLLETEDGFGFLCECGDPDCTEMIYMTLGDFAQTPPGSVSHD
jgi:hypothetical protein